MLHISIALKRFSTNSLMTHLQDDIDLFAHARHFGIVGRKFRFFVALKQAGIVAELTRAAKVIKSGELSRKITLRGVAVTAGAKAAIEAAGGNVIIDPPVEKPKKLPSKRV
jgi:hypothetical protein